MELITQESITEIIANQANPAVTMYIPTHSAPTPPHMTEDQIRFKNNFHKAAHLLTEQGEEKFAKAINAKLDEINADIDFWKHQSKGVLVCATADDIKMYRLPIDTEEYVSIGENFYLAPILSLMHENHSFYVLALAQHDPRLYIGDMYELKESTINLPESVEAALSIDEENGRTEHSVSAGGSSLNTNAYNGRGGARNPYEKDRQHYFQIIDHLLYVAADRKIPLILAGVDSDVAEYKAASKYPKLLDGFISGNFTNAAPQDLFEQAKEIMHHEIIAPLQQEVVEEYERISGANPDRVASEKRQIEEAAEEGRIDKLLVRMLRQTTDTVGDDYKSVERITFPEPDMRESINSLALKVWQMSGQVVSLASNKIPHGAPMLARLRY